MSEADYVSDVEYTSNFYSHLAPLLLNYIAAINGVRPRPTRGEFTYCELGCGLGVTAAILADLHPRGRFYALDMSAAHIAYARKLAEDGRLENLTLLQNTFAEALTMELPRFDFIVLHGVWSWVPENAREEIKAFIRAKLKTDGLVMVSYNAMPGWAHILPLRQMMHAYVSTLEGDSLARARAALGYLKFLADNKAPYFTANPAAAAHVAELLEKDLRYVAHEYITRHGDAFYFAQVEQAMAGVGLAYAGNMSADLNYAQIMAPEAFREFLASAPSRQVYETHRDLIVNTRFRSDLYTAQRDPPAVALETPALFAELRFALAQLPEEIELQGRSGALRFDLSSERARVERIFKLLAAGPASLEAVHAALDGSQPVTDTLRLLVNLAVVGRIMPWAEQAPRAPGWSPLNRALLELALGSGADAVQLGAPGLGTALDFPVPFALSIQLSIDCVSALEAGAHGLATLARHGRSLAVPDGKGGKRAANETETRDYFGAAWRELRDPASAEARRQRLAGFTP